MGNDDNRAGGSGGPWPGRYLLRPVLELALIYQRIRYGVDLDEVSPQKAVAQSHTPVLLIFGAHDDNTPARHARKIEQASSERFTCHRTFSSMPEKTAGSNWRFGTGSATSSSSTRSVSSYCSAVVRRTE